MNITVKNVPAAVYKVMKAEARRRRRSLNSQIIVALEAEAAEAKRRAELANALDAFERFAASLPPQPDSAPIIRANRNR